MSLNFISSFDLGGATYASSCVWAGTHLACSYWKSGHWRIALFTSSSGILTKVADVASLTDEIGNVIIYKDPFLFAAGSHIEALKIVGDSLTQNVLWQTNIVIEIHDMDIDSNWFLHCVTKQVGVDTILPVFFSEAGGFSQKTWRNLVIAHLHGVLFAEGLITICGATAERVRSFSFDPVLFTYTQVTNSSPINSNICLCMAYIPPYFYVSQNTVGHLYVLSKSGSVFSSVVIYNSPENIDGIVQESGRIYTSCYNKTRLQALKWSSGALVLDSELLNYGAPGALYNIICTDGLGYIYWVQNTRYVYSTYDTEGIWRARALVNPSEGRPPLKVAFTAELY